jgi:hypothetical protein
VAIAVDESNEDVRAAADVLSPVATGAQHPVRFLTGVVASAGAISWLVLFQLRLSRLPKQWWFARDDAVITLSHAKNLAEFGTIGVSPGDRVEGFSSPLHFIVATVVFRIVPMGYEMFCTLFLGTTVGAIGALVALCVFFECTTDGTSSRRSAVLAISLSVIAAVATLSTWTASGWMASGMENPLVIAASLSVAAFALSPSSSRLNALGAVVAVSALGIARVEFAAFILPLVIAVSIVQAKKAPVLRRRLVFLVTLLSPLVVLAGVHLARRLYFGAWLPNTAIVQGRAHGADQAILLVCLSGALVALIAHAALESSDWQRHRSLLSWVRSTAMIASVTFFGIAAWMTVNGRSKGSLAQALALPGLLVLGATLTVLWRLAVSLDGSRWMANLVFAGLVVVPVGQFVVMGPARLEKFRVVSMAIPILAAWAAVSAARLVRLAWPAHPGAPESRHAGWMLVPVAVLLGAALAWTRGQDPPRVLPFEVGGSSAALAVSDGVRAQELAGEGLPIVANPDLGKLSFAKRSLVVDLGLIGDPLLTEVSINRPDLVVTYLNEVAAPDVVELHGYWACRYTTWVNSPRFQAGWRLSDDRWLAAPSVNPRCALGGRPQIWQRSDGSQEFALTRDVARSDRPGDVIRTALDACRDEPGSAFRCSYVRRAVQRNVMVLKDRGHLADAVAALRESPSGPLDQRLVARGPNWAAESFREFTRLAERSLAP